MQVTRGDAGLQRGGGRGGVPAGQQHVHDLRAGARLQLRGGARGDDHAVVEHVHHVGEPVGLLQVLGGQQHGGAGLAQFPERGPELQPAGRVQPGGRLVQDQQGGPVHQAGRQVQAAAHPARVGPHRPADRGGQAEALGQPGGAPGGLAPPEPGQAADQHEVVPAVQALVQAGVLAGQPDDGTHRVGAGRHVAAEHADRARVLAQQRGQDAHQGRLAGAVGAEQRGQRPGTDGQIDPAQRADGAE